MTWAASHRRQRLGKSGWQQQADAKRILARHLGVCHVCKQGGATEVDHVIPAGEGGPDTDANKRPIHAEPCHKQKTQAESQRAKQRLSRLRPAEPHPGWGEAPSTSRS